MRTETNRVGKNGIKICSLFLTLMLLTAGCAPEEKTLLLPSAQSTEEAVENTDPANDFSVKKIYAYTYMTVNVLQKSAFLQNSGENTIRIATVEEQEDGKSRLVCREVDYRYGFYDTEGEYFDFREKWEGLWLDQEDGIQQDLSMENILPSPDGRQLLVYSGSMNYYRNVRLYTLGVSGSWILYDGVGERDYFLKGSFSPDGKWVTFDVAGVLTDDKGMVPVYDCGRRDYAGDGRYQTGQWDGYTCRYYTPDEFFYAAGDQSSALWSAELYNTPSGAPGLISFCRHNGSAVSMEMQYRPEAEASAGKLCLLGKNSEENEKESNVEENIFSYEAKMLPGYEGMPFLQYRVSGEEGSLYYMGNVFQLWKTDLNADAGEESIRIFPEMVWDFLPLESGELLVLLGRTPGENSEYQNSNEKRDPMNKWDGTSYPYRLQNYWDIQSGDLYLYPADGSGGRLLYKNVQNFLGMEYDPGSKRILLETYENNNLARRRCIILEL